MIKIVFVDADIILDLLSFREPFYLDAAKVFSLGDNNLIKIVTSSVVIANVHYILRKKLGNEESRKLLRKLRLIVGIVGTSEKAMDLALNSSFKDFEDAIQYFSALEGKASVLLTRNLKDYPGREIIVQSPNEFLKSHF